MKSIRLSGILLVLLCLGFGCSTRPNIEPIAREPVPEASPSAMKPLQIGLRDGEKRAEPGAAERRFVKGTALGPGRVDELRKLFGEALPARSNGPEFLKRDSSKPSPRAVTVKELAAPTDPGQAPPPEVKGQGLQVVSISPEGNLDRAPRLSISFNSPMISVTDPEAEEADDPKGVTIEPRPAGRWRWLGTQTLIFEPEGGLFPRATEYRVTVPQGLSDVRGNELKEAKTQDFALAPAKVESFSPTTPGQGLSPLISVVFDQPVESVQTLPLIRLYQGALRIPLQRLSWKQAEKLEKGATTRFKEKGQKRVFFFRPARELNPGRTYSVEVAAGVKSAEGPVLSSEAQSGSFSTFDELRLVTRRPEKGDTGSPNMGFYLRFNNDLSVDGEGLVSVTPSVENFKVMTRANGLLIDGKFKAHTTYKVTVSSQLKDVFGQRLGKKLELEMKTGGLDKELKHGFENFTVLQPGVAPKLPIFSTNIEKLTLQVNRVEPQDWPAYLEFLEAKYDRKLKKWNSPPGTQLVSKELTLEKKPDELVSTYVDLSEYLDEGQGNLIVWVRDPITEKNPYSYRQFVTWVQGTRLGIDIETGAKNGVVLVTDLASGKPISGAEIELGKVKKSSNVDGTCVFELPDTEAPILLVNSKDSQAFLPRTTNSWYSEASWVFENLKTETEWFLFDDRGLYKPGETAHIKGYVRSWRRGPLGQLVLPKEGSEVSWKLTDELGNKLKEGKTKLDSNGGIDLGFAIPSEVHLGDIDLEIRGEGLGAGFHTLKVQEFRRPEFEVTTKVVSDSPHLLLDSATVESRASYYSGGGLAGTEVDWEVRARPSSYTPPGREEYTFGKWVPWWNLGCWGLDDFEHEDTSHFTYTGKTDTQGEHQLAMDFLEMNPPQPTNVEVTATVTDVNRQQQSSTTNLLVHPSQRYVGLKADKTFVDEESGFELKAIVTDIEGRLLPGVPVKLDLLRIDYSYTGDGGYQQREIPVQKKIVTSSEVPESVALSPKEGGTYRIRATVLDKDGRFNQTEYTFWKAGAQLPSSDKVEIEELTVVPDRKEYKPGETARLLVMAPFAEGEGLVAWARDGLLREDRFTLKNGTAILTLPVTEEMIPNVGASITVVGKTPRGGGERPAAAVSTLDLAISAESRRLTVEIQPGKVKLEPGADVDLPVVVKDSRGRPVTGADVTLWAVDEAVLGLAGYQMPEPLTRFYRHRPSQLSAGHSRKYIVLGEPVKVEEPEPVASPVPLLGDAPVLGTLFRNKGRLDNDGLRWNGGNSTVSGPGYLNYDSLVGSVAGPSYHGDGFTSRGLLGLRMRVSDDIDAGAEFSRYDLDFSSKYGFDITGEVDAKFRSKGPKGPKKFTIRKNFNSLAVYKAALKTDTSGRTTVHTKLPDSLTRYRIIAVAAKDADKFGYADSSLTARLPLMVRPSLPRFLNFGDKAKLPVVLQNQTDKDMTVEVVAEATGVTLLGASGQRVKVPANDRVEVLFEAQADTVGQAMFRFGAVSQKFSDASTVGLPVYTPAATEEFATYGQLTDNGAVAQKVKRPDNVWSQFGGLRVSLSSTALSELTEAFLYLYNYPYECSEQKSSRMISILAMGDVLEAFNPEGMPSKQEFEQKMKSDILHLEQLQNTHGGWDYWVKQKDSNPFVTVHVMHALTRAQRSGYEVKATTLSTGKEYLKRVESICRMRKWDEGTVRSCAAYALYVRELLKDADVAAAKALFNSIKESKNPDLEALGWLWPTLSKHAKGSAELKELKRLVMNQATQTAETARFTTQVSEAEKYVTLHSSRRTDAILLNGLLTDEATNPLAAKLVRGLLAHRTKGRWSNTQENIWVLLALQSYFKTYEKQTPKFTAGVWLDKTFLGEETFAGRSNKEAALTRPMRDLADKEKELILSKQGTGRLYYRVGMKFAPKSLRGAAESRGFTLERSYKGVDKPEDVQQLENGDWKIKAGAKVEVTLTMVCPQRRYHVALVDQLPAGLEPLNPALQGTPKVQENSRRQWWNWYEHDNLRDERVEAFATTVYPGVYTYSYTALATTPGDYVLPPLKAEEMYSPEVFGRTATGRLVIE